MQRRSAVRHRLLAVTATSAAAGLLAGCGGADDTKDPKVESELFAPTRTLSADELEDRAVTARDLPGHKISKPAEADRVAPSAVTTSQPECRIQALVAAGTAPGDPASVVYRKAVGRPTETRGVKAHGPLTTTVTLASYSKKAWKKVFYDLGYSSTVCQLPFDLTQHGETSKAQSVPKDDEPQEQDPASEGPQHIGHGAEETWSQTLTHGTGTSGRTHKTLLQRMGNTLIITSRTYPGALSPQSVPSGLPFPTSVAGPQLREFGWN